jgi:hypothetical protein
MPESGLSATSGKSCNAFGRLHFLELDPRTSGTGLQLEKCFGDI